MGKLLVLYDILRLIRKMITAKKLTANDLFVCKSKTFSTQDCDKKLKVGLQFAVKCN